MRDPGLRGKKEEGRRKVRKWEGGREGGRVSDANIPQNGKKNPNQAVHGVAWGREYEGTTGSAEAAKEPKRQGAPGFEPVSSRFVLEIKPKPKNK